MIRLAAILPTMCFRWFCLRNIMRISRDMVRSDTEDNSLMTSKIAPSSSRIADDVLLSSPKNGMLFSDRRIKRQIANCNERRRMRSINAGFQNLRSLLPRRNGKKISKAAILQQSAELIQSLQADKSRLVEEIEFFIQSKKVKSEGLEKHERVLVDDISLELGKERLLRLFFEQQLRELSANSPHMSSITVSSPSVHFSHSLLDASALQTQTTDRTGLVPRSLEGVFVNASYSLHNCLPSMNRAALNVIGGIDQNVIRSAVDLTPRPQVVASSNLTSITSNRNLSVILEAIHHLDGGASETPGTSLPLHQYSNVMVR